ncbi:sigma-70 family RNA polymerase sigma factor [Nocardia amikacinitolerans]|uniref:sigma-70 family RNA polymerase sigma factor n=1 Tax=Nocardia amikacinitolerans TaxID=756689 RepID=UPI0020A4082B|nr:sigma-70 family RNA polymerase sigma factor [Nocardia amikacinitolerans]MCP2275159.1 RNA polymerase, sigma subunit, ECF family [Nocardia amikacinitolerans]
MTASSVRVAEPEFERMVAPLRAELHVHCYRMLGSVHDADDAVQESLVRAWRNLDKLTDPAGLRPWLYRIATNRCLTLLETRRRRELPVDLSPGAPLTDIAWLDPYPDADVRGRAPEARYEAREAVELAFVAALQYLPGLQRAALVLRDVLGFSARETAELLEISVASANSALQRARAGVEARLPARSQQHALHTMTDHEIRDLAQQYVAAWESGDVTAIVALLSADAKYSMPPLPEWYAGEAAIREFLLGGPLRYRWRFLLASANGQLAFGTYLWDDERAVFAAMALDVVAVRDGRIAEVVSFLEPALFPSFGLPVDLPA